MSGSRRMAGLGDRADRRGATRRPVSSLPLNSPSRRSPNSSKIRALQLKALQGQDLATPFGGPHRVPDNVFADTPFVGLSAAGQVAEELLRVSVGGDFHQEVERLIADRREPPSVSK